MYLWGQNYHKTFQMWNMEEANAFFFFFSQSNSLKILKDSTFKAIIWWADASVLHHTTYISKNIGGTVPEYSSSRYYEREMKVEKSHRKFNSVDSFYGQMS